MDGATPDLGLEIDACVYKTHADALNHLRERCHECGFSVKKKRDNQRQTADQVATIYNYVCGRAGMYKNYRSELTEATRQRSTKTSLCGCQFKASIRVVGDGWIIQIDNAEHNHRATTELTALRHARQVRPQHKEIIKTMTAAGATVRTTLATIEAADSTAVMTDRNVSNARRKIRESELDGRTEMAALVDELFSTSTPHALQTDRHGHCIHLMIIPRTATVLTAAAHDLLIIDSTYRTNRYDMPLLHVVGRTNTSKTFTISVCFMRRETTEDYRWAIAALRRLLGEYVQPRAIVIDRELALMKAVSEVYPAARHILCAWHVSKNIATRCKVLMPAQPGESGALVSWEEFSQEWSRLVLYTLDAAEFDSRWHNIAARLPQATSSYIERQWLNPWKSRFCAAFLLDARHYGSLTTSRVEGCHAALKAWIPNANSSLLGVYKAVLRHSKRQSVVCLRERERQLQPRPIALLDADFFADVLPWISHKALSALRLELEKARAPSTTSCFNYMRNGFGLPCTHSIRSELHTAESEHRRPRLKLEEFSNYWLLEKPNAVAQAVSVLSPRRALSRRGGKRRASSAFEVAEKESRAHRCGWCKQIANHNRASCPKRSA